MTFSENNSLLPGGSVSASEVKKLNEKINNLSQTVTSVADSVSALSNEVDTSSLNASNAVIDNATIGSETVTSADITSAEIDSADITDADIANADVNDLTADNASITDLTVSRAYANSVNSVSFTGQTVHVSDNIQTDKNLVSDGLNTDKATINEATIKDIEITGDTTVRGDVYFPENGDKIYGEYLEVDANEIKGKTVKAVNLTTETPSGTNNLVGYDVSTGKLIPVDASLDPTVLWEQDSNDQTTIVPKSNKNVKVPGLAVTGQMAVTDEAYFLDEVTMQDNLGVQGYTTIGGDLTVNQDVNTDDLNVTNDAQIGNDLNVDGDTTLDDTTIDGTLQVNGDIIQSGSAYETHAEKVYTKDDLIITRDGAVGALGPTEVTGIQAKKYDGTNDGQLVFDRNGEARVGDVGDTEPLLTRDELANMTDARPLLWDGTNSKAVTGTSGQADALNSGATSAKIASIGNVANLNTQAKDNLVNAINECFAGVSPSDIFDLIHPIGETYVQYPDCPSPNDMWSDFSTWTELNFAGAFFRASGGNAQAFANQQTAQADMIKTHTTGNMSGNATGSFTTAMMNLNGSTTMAPVSKSGFVTANESTGNPLLAREQDNYKRATEQQVTMNIEHTHTYGNATDNPETRPVNYTVKIWKRTA